MKKTAVFWFRRDLRLFDNHALFRALKENDEVLPLFIFDSNITSELQKNDKRISFIYDILKSINSELCEKNSSLIIRCGAPEEIFHQLIQNYSFQSVYCNEDYEPYAIARDKNVKELLLKQNIAFHSCCDQVIFSKNDILKPDGKPYTVFTPYKNKWLGNLNQIVLASHPSEKLESKFKSIPNVFPSLESIGFKYEHVDFPSMHPNDNIIINYTLNRDYPALQGTSRLGIHFRFGTVSIREWVAKAKKLNDAFLNELIWREFYMMILYHFPHSATSSFKSFYNKLEWLNNLQQFEAWCNGQTGYPMVDAGMRELNSTGFMHNRLRMITASFLCKHLLCDWRLGEAYFTEKLLDYDLAANIGGWQWAAGTGCDAAPYFRIFNPMLQQKRFDKNFEYVSKWIPELISKYYPTPIVEHNEARERCIRVYKSILG